MLSIVVALRHDAPLAAQPFIRETPTTLVVPIPGSGVPGGVPGTGGGAFGTLRPATLSQTGAFSDLAQIKPTRGLVPYEPNASLWSDFAKKTRWFALNTATSTFGFRRDGSWGLPIGAVWVKHFDLELRRGDPASVRRVETRFLVCRCQLRPMPPTWHWRGRRVEFLTNTRWNTAANLVDLRAAGQRVGAFALAEGSGDSAILADLSPGPYTIQISGLNGATGVALVEVSEVPAAIASSP